MNRYIDAEHLMEKVSRMIEYCEKNKDKKFNALNVLFQVGDAIMDCPTADVAPIADTVRKMQERLKQAICDNTYPDFNRDGKPVNIWRAKTGYDAIDQIAKEMIEKGD